VEALLAAGAINAAQAEAHPDANRITRALGIAPEIEPEVGPPLLVEVGDTFILCSDGLSDLVGDTEIGEGVAAAATPELACEQLVALANSRGGHDNITVSVARVLTLGTERRRETVEITRDAEGRPERVAPTVVMTQDRRPSNTLPSERPSDRPRDTSPTLVDPTVVEPALQQSGSTLHSNPHNPLVSHSGHALLGTPAPNAAARPSIPAQTFTQGRVLFWIAAIVCVLIFLAIALWWIVR
jgi:protein phosphatase